VDAYRAPRPGPYAAPTPALAALLYGIDPEADFYRRSEPGTISVLPMTQQPPRGDVTVKPATVGYGRDLLDQVSAWVDGGVIKPLVSAVFPFADALKAYEHVMTGHARGKVVLDMGGGS
jgi:hypothetical protein